MAVQIKKFLRLQTALINEKARIEARLIEIARVLEGDMPPVAPASTVKKGRRKFSEATKAKMRAAQQARWAKKKDTAAPAEATSPKKKRKMTDAGRAAIAAAAKARWAKVKAGKSKAGL